jgi:bile acid:Na+ symporter, BASS family
MEQNFFTTLLLPLSLAVIMLGMGLNLVMGDFGRIFRYPKAAAIGLINQLVLLPLIGYLILLVFSLPPELAVGVMILAACPGGPTSNLITYLAKGDIALSVTLTAFSTLIAMFTIPFVVNFSIQQFMPAGQTVTLPLAGTIVQLFIIAVVPVALGMLIRKYALSLAIKAFKPVRILSAVFLVVVIAGVFIKERANILEFFAQAGPVTLTLNLLTLLLGYFSSRLFRLSNQQSLTVSIESGIQNGTLAIAIAATMLQNTAMTIPSAIYSLIMFFTAAIVVAIALNTSEKKGPVAV